MTDLFESDSKVTKDEISQKNTPLAEKLRPKSLNEVVGQDRILAADGQLTLMVKSGQLASIIFWGPPGVGKTTIARAIVNEVSAHYEEISAIFSGVSDLKKLLNAASVRHSNGARTILFVDEIHRFNKSQQDSFLPYMENGSIILMGATTENPSFELNSALLSRSQVLILERLKAEDLLKIFNRAIGSMKNAPMFSEAAISFIIDMSDGDGRSLLNYIEQVGSWESNNTVTEQDLKTRLSRRIKNYDKKGDEHFNLISALHKSVRGSDPDGALYWLARMLEGGEDPNYICRRLVRIAAEDIGLADLHAASICIETWQAYERLGSPEGDLSLARAVCYLALAPKSNAVYKAFNSAKKLAQETGSMPPPLDILNAPTQLMKENGFGDGYIYDHDSENAFAGQNFFPKELSREVFFNPVERGFERELKKRVTYFEKLRLKRDRDM
ncbi:MAG: replication-associated recombination protein A [Rhodobacteraceae bacterium]|nr:replication-associated recombination protein A [Paracoccaceae bacterium]